MNLSYIRLFVGYVVIGTVITFFFDITIGVCFISIGFSFLLASDNKNMQLLLDKLDNITKELQEIKNQSQDTKECSEDKSHIPSVALDTNADKPERGNK